MKTRNGFVSNSSSSSFVVAVQNTPESLDKLLASVVRMEMISDEEQLWKVAEEQQGGYDGWEEDVQESYFFKEQLKEIRNGNVIVIFDVDWGDEHAYYILNNESKMEELNARFIGDQYG